MSTYTQILYHIVFSTKNRRRTLIQPRREELFRYIWGIIQNEKGRLFRINGVDDHIHILTSLHPTKPLSDLVKDIKTGTSKWMKEIGNFPHFDHWQDGYAAFTHSNREKPRLVDYIRNQERHHQRLTFDDELRRMLNDAGISFDPQFLT